MERIWACITFGTLFSKNVISKIASAKPRSGVPFTKMEFGQFNPSSMTDPNTCYMVIDVPAIVDGVVRSAEDSLALDKEFKSLPLILNQEDLSLADKMKTYSKQMKNIQAESTEVHPVNLHSVTGLAESRRKPEDPDLQTVYWVYSDEAGSTHILDGDDCHSLSGSGDVTPAKASKPKVKSKIKSSQSIKTKDSSDGPLAEAMLWLIMTL